jgi:hypothetical protein
MSVRADSGCALLLSVKIALVTLESNAWDDL